MTAPSGLLIIDKPDGITSHGVVSAVRRALNTRKVGHAGTLDPMATGVLVVGVGRATRLLGYLALNDKAYRATIRLGASTVTDDAQGDLVSRAPESDVERIDDAAIAEVVTSLTGAIEQVPSAVSAIKVDGKRAHALVRSGEDVELKARNVTVSRFDLLSIRRDVPGFIDCEVEVECSTGTYVRALGRDLGGALGVGGHLTSLRRLRVGAWTVDEAVDLADISSDQLIDIDQVAARSFTSVVLDPERVADVRHGRAIAWPDGASGVIALTDASGHLVALAEQRRERARTLVVFAD